MIKLSEYMNTLAEYFNLQLENTCRNSKRQKKKVKTHLLWIQYLNHLCKIIQVKLLSSLGKLQDNQRGLKSNWVKIHLSKRLQLVTFPVSSQLS